MSEINEKLTDTTEKATKTYSTYFAGALFDIRQLHGNALFAADIENFSEGKFKVILPQNTEVKEFDPHLIRDDDFQNVISADLCIVQFDGTELDSGTVAEFMMAKMADIPTLILRTDFRSSGDQAEKGDSWNLMLSNYPRTQVLCVNSMALYKAELLKLGENSAENSITASANALASIARDVIAKLELLIKEPAIMPEEVQKPVFSWLARFPGYKIGAEKANEFMMETLERKQETGQL